jgi:hypothetical protein
MKRFGKGDAERAPERPGSAGTAEREARGEEPFLKKVFPNNIPSVIVNLLLIQTFTVTFRQGPSLTRYASRL